MAGGQRSCESVGRAGSRDDEAWSMFTPGGAVSALMVVAIVGAEDRPGSQCGGEEMARGRGELVEARLTEETARRSA